MVHGNPVRNLSSSKKTRTRPRRQNIAKESRREEITSASSNQVSSSTNNTFEEYTRRIVTPKTILDKVEDMEVDDSSDINETDLEMSLLHNASLTAQNTSTGDTCIRRTKNVEQTEQRTQLNKNEHRIAEQAKHETKVLKKKTIYIIFHASLVKICNILTKATSPIRIQAERLLMEIEMKFSTNTETQKIRIPFRELAEIQVNLLEPPYLFAVVINETYSKSDRLFCGSKKNRVTDKIRGNKRIEVIIEINGKSISKEVKEDMRMLREQFSSILRWTYISSSQAEMVIKNGKIVECSEVKKEQGSSSEKEIVPTIEEKPSLKEDSVTSSTTIEQSTTIKDDIKCRKRLHAVRTYVSKDQEQRNQLIENSTFPDNKEPQFSYSIHSEERSFEENRLQHLRIIELEQLIKEKEGLLNQKRIGIELRELQLKEEENMVKVLREDLKEEQERSRCFEFVSNDLRTRNNRVEQLEQELSQLNSTLNTIRSDNERLMQELHDVRVRNTEHEKALQDLVEERTRLELLRGDMEAKDNHVAVVENDRRMAVERQLELEESLSLLRQQHEQQQRTLQENYDNCNRRLITAQDQLATRTRALHQAQQTIEEYSRMQPRDWTIARHEIQVGDVILGEGAWGWVKEGLFRGTKVAVKQMHELIVSPHNRRLFEREMQMAARCRHPNLLQFIGATSDNGLALLITELLQINLRNLLSQRTLSHDEVITLSRDVALALNYLHLNKPFPIIHRDISSTNVLLWKRDDTWHAKLSDYGAANFLRQSMTSNPGALIYSAPEAMTSQQSTKVDVYSFGLLLCEMCIRELPVPEQITHQIQLITNAHLRDLVQRCTHTEPENRPTMQSALQALDHLHSNTILGSVAINKRHVIL